MKTTLNTRSGFTLIEVIAVLVLLGILAAVAVPRYIDVTEAAADRAIDAGIAELNGRETLNWANLLLEAGSAGGVDDAAVFAELNTDLGPDYNWGDPPVAPTESGGTLYFGATAVPLTRTAPTDGNSPARWSRTP